MAYCHIGEVLFPMIEEIIYDISKKRGRERKKRRAKQSEKYGGVS